MSEVLEREKLSLKILSSVQRVNGYDVLELDRGYAKILFKLDNAETLDNSSTVFEAELYKAANFCALVCINEENTFVVNANVDFLTQVEVSSNEIVFEAKSISSSLGKKFIEVRAKIDEITVFMGNFTVLKMDGRSKIKI